MKEYMDDDGHMQAFNTRIYTLKTQVHREKTVANLLKDKSKKTGIPIYSIKTSPKMQGYIFIECNGPNQLDELIKGVNFVQGVLGEITRSEVERYALHEAVETTFSVLDNVEITKGDFKGMTGVVRSIDKKKENASVELVGELIPVTKKLPTTSLKKL